MEHGAKEGENHKEGEEGATVLGATSSPSLCPWSSVQGQFPKEGNLRGPRLGCAQVRSCSPPLESSLSTLEIFGF